MIHTLLARPSLGTTDRRALVEALRAGPWSWPAPEDGALRARAEALAGGEPAEPRPGETLLSSVREDHAAVWVVRPGGPPDPPFFGSDALTAWACAASALPRSLPFLWSSIRQVRDAVPRARMLGWLPLRDGARPPSELDGHSFGLAFVLAQASGVLGVPVPPTHAALATVGADGAVGPVDALDAKIRALAAWAPGVRRLLVAPGQEAVAEAAADRYGLPARAVGVESASKAVGDALGDSLASRLVAAGDDPDHRRELVRSLFRLGCASDTRLIHWEPVARAAELALDRWTDLTDDERVRLSVVHAIVNRHEGHYRPLVVSPEWLERVPAQLRITLVAQIVQHAVDFGDPLPSEAEALGRAHLVRGVEAYDVHLRLLGALGRLYAVTNRPAVALEMQEEAARGFLERDLVGDISYPLAEWYRLVAALGDADAWDRAEAMRREAETLGAFGLDGSPFVELSRARAQVSLGRDLDEAARTLRGLVAGHDRCPLHVSAAAARWLARCDSVTDWPLDGRCSHPVVATQVALTALDRALARGELGDAELAAVRTHDPRLVDLLRAHAPSPSTAPAHVARFYPY